MLEQALHKLHFPDAFPSLLIGLVNRKTLGKLEDKKMGGSNFLFFRILDSVVPAVAMNSIH